MVVLIHQFVHHPLHLQLSPPSLRTTSSRIRTSIISSSSSSSSSSMDPQINRPSSRFLEFPHLSTSHRNLMLDLVSTMETTLSSHLLPSSLPPDIQYFQNQSATSQGSLHIRSGNENSLVDCILGSWIHCELPTGGALDITTLTAYLNTKTDSPRFLIEFLQSSPKSLILLLDLPPRKDLVINPDYLKTFYQETHLEEQRKKLQNVTEIKPYISSSLYIRCLLSPTAITVTVDSEAGGPIRMEEIIRDHVGPVAKDMLEIWLNQCVSCGGREMEESEKVELEKRDILIKKKTVEMDLASSLPRLFGEDVASRVIKAIEKAFHI
ncbi:Red chlorophyll catabolite reductase [Macleaya cordata]|uniref:Red chlorophyll catabolite reductase n=1 Tax=Macleaya cordata TaxID=56857 RepID=A0A200QZL6_MACCD|nr:Red chlorophyll catabolite reductase [Macleaya cordata]